MKKILSIVVIIALFTMAINAIGTAAGTNIENQATLSFSVGGIPQTAVPSNEDIFVVDKKIDFKLTNDDSEQIDVIPASVDQVTTWSVTNEGNMDQNFTFTAAQLTGGETIYSDADTKNSEALTLEYQKPDNSWITLITLEIAVGDTIAIRIQTDIAAARVDGDVMNISLTAVAVTSTGTDEQSTSGSDNQSIVDTVLAEGVGVTGDAKEDGIFVAWGGYIVVAPNLSLAKSSCVLEDPIKGITSPKRIPGATVLYVLDIINGSPTTVATDVNISDTLASTLDILTLANLKYHDGQASCSCTDGTAYSGGTAFTNVGTGQVVKVTGLTITNATHNCVSFEVKIK